MTKWFAGLPRVFQILIPFVIGVGIIVAIVFVIRNGLVLPTFTADNLPWGKIVLSIFAIGIVWLAVAGIIAAATPQIPKGGTVAVRNVRALVVWACTIAVAFGLLALLWAPGLSDVSAWQAVWGFITLAWEFIATWWLMIAIAAIFVAIIAWVVAGVSTQRIVETIALIFFSLGVVVMLIALIAGFSIAPLWVKAGVTAVLLPLGAAAVFWFVAKRHEWWIAVCLGLLVVILWLGFFGSLLSLPTFGSATAWVSQHVSEIVSSHQDTSKSPQKHPTTTCTQANLAELLNCLGLKNIQVVPDQYGTVGFTGEMPAGKFLTDSVTVPARYYVAVTNNARTIADLYVGGGDKVPQTVVAYTRIYSLFAQKGQGAWCGWFSLIVPGESTAHPHGCTYDPKAVNFGSSVKALGFHGDTHLLPLNGKLEWGKHLAAGNLTVAHGANYQIVVTWNHGFDTHAIVSGHSYVVPANATVYVVPAS